jgi:protein gp37
MKSTNIEWTDATWNPIRGCSKVSDGCRNCYAEKVAYRFSGAGQPYEGLMQIAKFDHSQPGMPIRTERRLPIWNGNIRFVEEHLLDPLRWKKPRRIFVNSMSDLFHENVTDEMLDRIFAVMALCPQHTFQVLTKRPERMYAYLEMIEEERDMQCWANAALEFDLGPFVADAIREWEWPLRNVWLGVSVENQPTADVRIPLLMKTPAAVRFISAEPLLGLIDFESVPCVNAETLDWIIVGGESGPCARPFNIEWARSVVEQCAAARVACFVKQLGAKVYSDTAQYFNPKAACYLPMKNRKGGDMSEWPEDLRVRQFPEARA